ncbi:MAG: multiple sugar transport system substrate-binding protein, partial [Microbacteriaceae bacterium]|nr:multiple sugar transport system substrate-binding protein [Microbacteriaceae bacterium]
MKIRTIAAVATVAAVLVATAACSSGGTASTSSSGTAGKTLTYWASNQGTSIANDTAVLTPELAKFKKQTGITVKLEVIGWNDLQTRIQSAVTSGQAPDVVNIGNTWA